MKYSVTTASGNDLAEIYSLFEEAIRFQKENNYIGWENYDKEFLQSDIQNALLFKMTHENNDIICIFSICYSDPLIWRQKEIGDAVYLHRIVVNRKCKAKRTFQDVLEWAILLALEKKLKYIRMDTWAENEKIISYYKSYGFWLIEYYTTPDTENLPVQHRNLHVALLELDVQTKINENQ